MRIFENRDCMEGMSKYPDKYFDLAIVDPPYGIQAAKDSFGHWQRSRMIKKDWDNSPPGRNYFKELMRITNNQIIWGGNYFGLPRTRGFIVWDKGAGFKGRDFAECEYAWTSFDKNAKIYSRDPLVNRDYVDRIHPTQKPIDLYRWLLQKYADPGQIILDTHVGSASSLIACDQMGFDYVGFEIDKDYYDAACERIKRYRSQLKLEI